MYFCSCCYKDKKLCEHAWRYKQDRDSDWYECAKCGKQKDREYVP